MREIRSGWGILALDMLVPKDRERTTSVLGAIQCTGRRDGKMGGARIFLLKNFGDEEGFDVLEGTEEPSSKGFKGGR